MIEHGKDVDCCCSHVIALHALFAQGEQPARVPQSTHITLSPTTRLKGCSEHSDPHANEPLAEGVKHSTL